MCGGARGRGEKEIGTAGVAHLPQRRQGGTKGAAQRQQLAELRGATGKLAEQGGHADIAARVQGAEYGVRERHGGIVGDGANRQER